MTLTSEFWYYFQNCDFKFDNCDFNIRIVTLFPEFYLDYDIKSQRYDSNLRFIIFLISNCFLSSFCCFQQ